MVRSVNGTTLFQTDGVCVCFDLSLTLTLTMVFVMQKAKRRDFCQ